MTNLRSRVPLVAATALALFVLAGCAAAPKSYLAMDTANRPDPLLYRLRIVSIDGALKFGGSADRLDVEPGLRSVVLEAAPPELSQRRVQKTYSLPVEPCTSYVLAARRRASTELDWQLVVVEKNPVPDCDVEEERRKAGIARAR